MCAEKLAECNLVQGVEALPLLPASSVSRVSILFIDCEYLSVALYTTRIGLDCSRTRARSSFEPASSSTDVRAPLQASSSTDVEICWARVLAGFLLARGAGS